jgi:hypothetical protein
MILGMMEYLVHQRLDGAGGAFHPWEAKTPVPQPRVPRSPDGEGTLTRWTGRPSWAMRSADCIPATRGAEHKASALKAPRLFTRGLQQRGALHRGADLGLGLLGGAFLCPSPPRRNAPECWRNWRR